MIYTWTRSRLPTLPAFSSGRRRIPLRRQPARFPAATPGSVISTSPPGSITAPMTLIRTALTAASKARSVWTIPVTGSVASASRVTIPLAFHTPACAPASTNTVSGTGPSGSAVLDLDLVSWAVSGTCEVNPFGADRGLDGLPCTDDDPAPRSTHASIGEGGFFSVLPPRFRVRLTTGNAAAEIVNADLSSASIAVDGHCGGSSTGECLTATSGTPRMQGKRHRQWHTGRRVRRARRQYPRRHGGHPRPRFGAGDLWRRLRWRRCGDRRRDRHRGHHRARRRTGQHARYSTPAGRVK